MFIEKKGEIKKEIEELEMFFLLIVKYIENEIENEIVNLDEEYGKFKIEIFK